MCVSGIHGDTVSPRASQGTFWWRYITMADTSSGGPAPCGPPVSPLLAHRRPSVSPLLAHQLGAPLVQRSLRRLSVFRPSVSDHRSLLGSHPDQLSHRSSSIDSALQKRERSWGALRRSPLVGHPLHMRATSTRALFPGG